MVASSSILPNGESVFLSDDGLPLAGGTIDFYEPGTTTRKITWQDSTKSAENENPLTLDAAGRAIIWGIGSYRQVLKDSLGNLVWDQVTSELSGAINDLQTEIDLINEEISVLSQQISNINTLINTQVFNTAGDTVYNATVGTNAIMAFIQAGGGGGSGVTGPGSSSKVSIGGGGGGGEFLQSGLITSGFSGATLTIGAGGARGAPGANAGSDGGNSVAFNLTAHGGKGGDASVQAATPPVVAVSVNGGVGSTGPAGGTERPGGPSGNQLTQSTALASSGAGGSSNYSPGALSATAANNSQTAGIGPTGPGGGASGAVSSGASGGAAPGATGGVGSIIINEYGSSAGGTGGFGAAATKADEESGTLNSVYTNPLVQQYHDSAMKVVGTVAADGTTVTGYKILSSAVLSTGNRRVTYSVEFANEGYAVLVAQENSGGGPVAPSYSGKTTTTVDVHLWDGVSLEQHDMPFSLMCAGRLIGTVGGVVTQQIFTSGSGTYTPTPGTLSILVELCGAGGGSSGISATSLNQSGVGQGGEGGGYCRRTYLTGFSSLAYAVGAAGLAGIVNDDGGDGGDTSFDVMLGGGGGGGINNASNQAVPFTAPSGARIGGVASGGELNIDGGLPIAGYASPGSAGAGSTAVGGCGGSSWLAQGAIGPTLSGVIVQHRSGTAAYGYGAGAGGGCNVSNSLQDIGAAGGSGIIIVTEFH